MRSCPVCRQPMPWRQEYCDECLEIQQCARRMLDRMKAEIFDDAERRRARQTVTSIQAAVAPIVVEFKRRRAAERQG